MAFTQSQNEVLDMLKKGLAIIKEGAMREDFPDYSPFQFFKSKDVQNCSISDSGPTTDNLYDHDELLRNFAFDGKLLDSIGRCWSKSVSVKQYSYEWTMERRLDWSVTFLAHEIHHISQKSHSAFHRELSGDGFSFDKLDYRADAVAIEVNYRLLPGTNLLPNARVAEIIAVICHSTRIFSTLEENVAEEVHISGPRLRRNLCWLFQYSRYLAMVDARGIREMDIHSEVHLEAIVVGVKGKNLCVEEYVNRSDFKNAFNLQITYDSLSENSSIQSTMVEIASIGSPKIFGFIVEAVFDFNLYAAREVFRGVFARNRHFLQPFLESGVVREEMVDTINFATIPSGKLGGRPYLDDALEISPYDIPADELPVKLQYRYDSHGDVFDGMANPKPAIPLVDGWFRSYDPRARTFFDQQLDDHKSNSRHECKIGFVAFDSSLNDKDVSEPLVEIRPLNHLVTELFNRNLGRNRVTSKTDPTSNRIWETGMAGLLRRPQDFRMIYPSQLFIEFALITSDGQVPISIKNSTNSIYALRNNKTPVWTCGLEYGPNWEECVELDPGSLKAKINLMSASLKALRTEYKITYRDQRSEHVPAPDELHAPKKPVFRFTSLVLQGIHFNTALLGYCILPFTQATLKAHLKKLGTLKGLDFKNLEWVSLADCMARVERDRTSASWHGTGLKRLQSVSEFQDRIEEILPTMR